MFLLIKAAYDSSIAVETNKVERACGTNVPTDETPATTRVKTVDTVDALEKKPDRLDVYEAMENLIQSGKSIRIATNTEDAMLTFRFTHQELANIHMRKAAITSQYTGALLDGPVHLEVKTTGFDVAADVPLREIEEALAGKVFLSRGQVMSVAAEVNSTNMAAGKAVADVLF